MSSCKAYIFNNLGVDSCFGPSQILFPGLKLPSQSGPPILAALPYNPSMQASQIPFFRPGGRTAAQLRPLVLTPGFVQTAEGSVLVSLGNTRVLTNATIEQGCLAGCATPAAAG